MIDANAGITVLEKRPEKIFWLCASLLALLTGLSKPHKNGRVWVGPSLVPRPQYFAAANRFGSRGPGRKGGLDKNSKIEKICLNS